MLILSFDNNEDIKVVLTENECFKDDFLTILKNRFGDKLAVISNSDLTVSKEIFDEFMDFIINELSKPKPKPNRFINKMKSFLGAIWKI
ncbi:MAG TPA: hypothetical protein V6C58_03350 [Allocoleopsis sp.]